MGTRIHKVLGYGLENYLGKYDKRFTDGWAYSEGHYDDKRDAFIKFLKEKFEQLDSNGPDRWTVKRMISDFEERVFWSPSDWIHESAYSPEQGRKKRPIVFSAEKDQRRYDDMIDYYEADGPSDNVKNLGKNYIYPHCTYVDDRTGVPPSNQIMTYIRGWNDVKLKGYSSDLLEEFKLTVDEFEKHVWPQPPVEIRLFVEFINAFKDPLDIYKLRPMIYTYWC